VCPAVEDAPMLILPPEQTELLPPVLFPGNGFTLTTAEFEAEHPVAVIVSVKV
jgi:hypothetical protein